MGGFAAQGRRLGEQDVACCVMAARSLQGRVEELWWLERGNALGLISSKDGSFAQLLPKELGFISTLESSVRCAPSISLGLILFLLLNSPSWF